MKITNLACLLLYKKDLAATSYILQSSIGLGLEYNMMELSRNKSFPFQSTKKSTKLTCRSQSFPNSEPLYKYVSLQDLLHPSSTCKGDLLKSKEVPIQNPLLKPPVVLATNPPREILEPFYSPCFGGLNVLFQCAVEKVKHTLKILINKIST